jgi:SAM-dependent methyltransferase
MTRELPAITLDAILVADTYHELTAPAAVLEHVFRALRPGGRLVVVDPAPGAGADDGPETPSHRYERPATAETELQRVGFAILDRDDRFIDTSRHRWWMIVASRTGA